MTENWIQCASGLPIFIVPAKQQWIIGSIFRGTRNLAITIYIQENYISLELTHFFEKCSYSRSVTSWSARLIQSSRDSAQVNLAASILMHRGSECAWVSIEPRTKLSREAAGRRVQLRIAPRTRSLIATRRIINYARSGLDTKPYVVAGGRAYLKIAGETVSYNWSAGHERGINMYVNMIARAYRGTHN